MANLDHSKINARDKVARRGADNIRDMGLPAGSGPPKARTSKAAQRAAASAAVAAITKEIRCQCGHRATKAIPATWAGRSLVCSRCGTRISA